MHPWLPVCERDHAHLVAFVRELVCCESPSTDRAALDACAAILVRHLGASGASVERIAAGSTAADHVLARWPGDGPAVLLLGHFDTVWPVGQIARMPVREEGGKLFGPGVFDMKAGIGIGVAAMRALAGAGAASRRPRVTMLVTSDEEVGSATSRTVIERLAKESIAALVLEPSLPGGALKTSRKGVGEFEIELHGISAHAGVDPGAGASAIHELAHVITAIHAWADPGRGLSINVGGVEGGTRPNVVAERARATVDVRASLMEDAAAVEAAFARLRPIDPRVRLTISGGMNRPPMVRSAGTAWLYEMARDVARGMGRDLGEGGTGGGSDGNFTAAIGVPTLDGLGAIGDGPHAIHEHVVVNELPWRAALVAGLIARLGDVG